MDRHLICFIFIAALFREHSDLRANLFRFADVGVDGASEQVEFSVSYASRRCYTMFVIYCAVREFY